MRNALVAAAAAARPAVSQNKT